MSAATDTANPIIYLLGHSSLDRLAYRCLLAEELRYVVAVDSDFRPTAVWACLRRNPDCVLVVADTPQPAVIDAVQMISRLRPETWIIVVSAAVEPREIEAWARCPLHAYVVKDGGPEELRAATTAAQEGREYYSPGIRELLSRAASKNSGTIRLSRREAELLPLLARGLTLREAASQLTISYKTADSYRTTLLRKLGVRDRVELARYAIRQHIIDP